jgi:bacteriorhodopsin
VDDRIGVFMMSIEQVIALIVVNIIGIVFLVLIVILMRKKTPNLKEKFDLSIKIGLISIMVFGVISSDLGIYLWIKSGNFRAVFLAIPLIICGSLFIFSTGVLGTYIQLIYRDKIQSFVDSHKR